MNREAFDKIKNSDAYKSICNDIDHRNKKMTNMEYSDYLAKQLTRNNSNEELVDAGLPEHIKQVVQNKVFDYLDEIGLEYVKAESAAINHNGKLIMTLIGFPFMAKRVSLNIINYNDADLWRHVEERLPGAIIHKIKEDIDRTLNLGLPIESFRRAIEVPDNGFGPDNLRDYTVLFKDFSEKIMQVPISPTDSLHGEVSRISGERYMNTRYYVSTYFDIVHKSQHGITPTLTNEIILESTKKEENILEKAVSDRYPSRLDLRGAELMGDTGVKPSNSTYPEKRKKRNPFNDELF